MNKSSLNHNWNQLRQKYGVYLRVLESLPEDKIGQKVIPGMRTPAEVAVHTSRGIVQGFAEGVATGEIVTDQPPSEIAAGIKSRADLLAYARKCWDAADSAMSKVGDDELSRMVKTPWNFEFPGSAAVHTLNDEFVHHRGQLYAMVRACGAEPPFVWSHDQNGEGFKP